MPHHISSPGPSAVNLSVHIPCCLHIVLYSRCLVSFPVHHYPIDLSMILRYLTSDVASHCSSSPIPTVLGQYFVVNFTERNMSGPGQVTHSGASGLLFAFYRYRCSCMCTSAMDARTGCRLFDNTLGSLQQSHSRRTAFTTYADIYRV